jgi:hypothetical protein
VTFIYDCPIKVWVFFLKKKKKKEKEEKLCTLKKWEALIENQSVNKIKQLIPYNDINITYIMTSNHQYHLTPLKVSDIKIIVN